MTIYQFEDADKLGFNPDKVNRLPDFFQSYIDSQRIPGISLLVARDKKIAHLSHSGTSGIGGGFDIDDETIFRIYSMSKPITSVALMMLVEQSKVMLQDPITKYLPSFKNVKVFESGTPSDYTTREPDRMITVHDLMTHQSGLTYDFMLEHPVDALYRNHKINGAHNEKYDLAEFCDALAEMPLLFSPGDKWNYSVSTDVIGRIVEIASGQNFAEFLSDNIFKPLGMVDTSFTIADDKLGRLINNYSRDPLSHEITLADSAEKTIYRPTRKFLSGGGGLLSTMRDYYIFADMLLRNGTGANGARILSRKTIAYMTANHLPDDKTLLQHGQGSFTEVLFNGIGFGLGVSVVNNPAQTMSPTSLGNYSWGGMASTYFWNDPQEDMVVIVMTQIMPSDSYPLRPQLQQLIYGALD